MSLCEVIAPRGITWTRDHQTAALARRLETARPGDWTATRKQWVIPWYGSGNDRAGKLALGTTPDQRAGPGELATNAATGAIAPAGAIATTASALTAALGGATAVRTVTQGIQTDTRAMSLFNMTGVLLNIDSRLFTTDPIPYPYEIVNVSIEESGGTNVQGHVNFFVTDTEHLATEARPVEAPLIQTIITRTGAGAFTFQEPIGAPFQSNTSATPHEMPLAIAVPQGAGHRLGVWIMTTAQIAVAAALTIKVVIRDLSPPARQLTAAPTPRPIAVAPRTTQTRYVAPPPPPPKPPPPPPVPPIRLTVMANGWTVALDPQSSKRTGFPYIGDIRGSSRPGQYTLPQIYGYGVRNV